MSDDTEDNKNDSVNTSEEGSSFRPKIDPSPYKSEEEAEKQFSSGPESQPTSEKTGTISDSTIITGNYNVVRENRSQIQQLTVELNLGGTQLARDVGSTADSGRLVEDKLHSGWNIHPLTPLSSLLEFNQQQLADGIANLTNTHLLLVSCYDESIARQAADSITSKLDIPETNRELLLFEKENDSPNLSIFALLSSNDDVLLNKLIVIDATNNSAVEFVDSLLVITSSGAGHIISELKNRNCLLICLIDPTRINRLLNEGKKIQFPYWRIPFLPYLLRDEFPENYIELQEKIIRQQVRGKWSQNEENLYSEIRPYILSRKLTQEIEAREVAIDSIDVSTLYDWGNPIINTLLYTATFFPDLTPGDFNQVILKLLGNRTMTIDQPNLPMQTENGYSQQPKQERPLTQIWREPGSANKFLGACNLKSFAISDRGRVISFATPSVREKLRNYFEEELPFDLENMFEVIREQNLMFDPSDEIAENAVNLIVGMAKDYPSQYGGEWLWQQLLGWLNGQGEKRITYKRFSDLLRRMLEEPQLKKNVGDIMELLIRNKQHLLALEIAKRLQYAPEFDSFYWLKQLVDRGGEDTSGRLYTHIYGLIKRQDSNIYDVLNKLEAWLPGDDREPYTYSRSNQMALSIVMHYCLQSLAEFEEEYYGLWPSRFPLFALTSQASVSSCLSLLTRWLFHPGMRTIIASHPLRLNLNETWGAIVSGWLFILLGDKDVTARAQGQSETHNVNNSDSPNILLMMLLEQIVSRTTIEQQKGMLAYWDALRNSVTEKLDSDFQMSGKARKEHILQRSLIKKLIEEFKAARKRVQMH